MSTATALAAVTAVLRDLLLNGIIDADNGDVGPVTVSAIPPDRVPNESDDNSRLNLFLYQVTPNQGWRNVGLPARSSAGDRVASPPLALDMHYLLSAYGTADFHAELLLGYAMQVLHETPVLTRDAIREAFTNTLGTGGSGMPAFLSTLGQSGLADQVEQIKITPVALGMDEMSKLWSATQAHFRTSACYQVSTVLIESRARTRESYPVRERRLNVAPVKTSVIESVAPQSLEAGGSLVLTGRSLAAEFVEVLFGDTAAAASTVTATDTSIAVSALPATLRAGVQTVRVAHGLVFGTPGDPHRGRESNQVPFILAPRITSPGPLTVAQGDDLTIAVSPDVRYDQRVRLIIGERAIEVPARTAPPGGPELSGTLEITIPDDFPVGTHPLRIEVDNARSALALDPVTETYATPSLEVTA
ncbi:MAG TPA: DUF4255 domain-containing protein [Longimicrobium sp.]|nr:DUF4255 domain-containing protein [Longimicrobium sp.]